MSNELAQKEFQFPTKPSDAFSHLQQIESEIKRLDSLKKKYRSFLAKAVPVEEIDESHKEGSVDGVRRLSFKQSRPSYAKALEQVVEELVPKTKHDQADKIVESTKKDVWVDKFSQDQEDEYGEF